MPDRTSRKRPASEPATERTEATETPDARHDPVACEVAFCPVSMLLTATGSVQPQVMEHLLAAGRELFLAAQVLINARAEAFERRSPLEKIEIG